MPRRLPVLAAGLALLAIAVVVMAAPRTSTATGVVVAVDSVSLVEVTAFTIRTADGVTIEFTVGALQNEVEFPPGHLVEHIATGAPVVVTFRDDAGARTAIRIADAPVPRAS